VAGQAIDFLLRIILVKALRAETSLLLGAVRRKGTGKRLGTTRVATGGRV
jgi:hypothetical protein